MLIVLNFRQKYECCGSFNCVLSFFINGEVLVQGSTRRRHVPTITNHNSQIKRIFAADSQTMGKRKQDTQIAIKNRKAEFLYYLHTSYTAGIVLTGTEIKSIRAGRANITDAYCSFINNELWVHNMHVSEYAQGSYNNHQPKRDRKLLLQRKEMRKLMTKLNERGFTIIPTLLWINENGYAKLDISLAKGKKMYDKRETIKERDQRRRTDEE